MDAAEKALRARRCRHLFWKGMGVNMGLSDDERVSGDGNFWCNGTQRIFGPDGELCGPELCVDVGRTCYESRDLL